jgi:23S rRNA pseudouridine2605 synthase
MDSQKPSRRNDSDRRKVRLNKYLAGCGLGSRRACEQLLAAGRVSVDGCVVSEQGIRVDPDAGIVKVDGKRVVPEPSMVLMLNKPKDVICTSSDPRGRRTFQSLLPRMNKRLFTVGRLDRDSEGLLLVTNDGDLAHALMHPGNRVGKRYRVWIGRKISPVEIRKLIAGVFSENEKLNADDVVFVENSGEMFVYDVLLHEGRNRHVRRMLEALNIKVGRLKRTALGSLELGKLRRGCWRQLSDGEIAGLRSGIS